MVVIAILCVTAYPDAESIKKDWAAPASDMEWQKLKSEPQYKDNVSKVLRYFLRPAAGPQI